VEPGKANYDYLFCLVCFVLYRIQVDTTAHIFRNFFLFWDSFANSKLSELNYDVITIDGSVPRSEARSIVGESKSLQGNYDPAELIESNGKTVESVKETARVLLEELGPNRLIANLGEGLGGKESPELVDAFVSAIHEESEKMMSS